MKVPYAKKWQKETNALRKLAVECGLVEEVKWSKPCFTFQKKNVAIIIPLKETCALAFFKGALLTDPKRILKKIGHQQSGRWIKFTSAQEISALKTQITRHLREAIRVEKSGKKAPRRKVSEYVMPQELQARLDADSKLKSAFEALTPGRRRSYLHHISSAKQAKTRAARAERCIPKMLSGRGYNEFSR
jgi:uncharacterized protein YdeI (YjbR/CyaY-like superfamily)